jgi:hypothetical protein
MELAASDIAFKCFYFYHPYKLKLFAGLGNKYWTSSKQ